MLFEISNINDLFTILFFSQDISDPRRRTIRTHTYMDPVCPYYNTSDVEYIYPFCISIFMKRTENCTEIHSSL